MKKVLKNIFASALPQIMNIITNLILPSMIILRFGSEINGLISSIKVIISYVSIVGAGIATATTQRLYEPVAKKQTNVVRGMLNASNKMFNKFGTIYCGIVLIVAILYPLFIETNIEYITIVLLMLAMSISGASEFFAIGRCRSLLYADQKTYVCTLAQAASIFLSLLIALLMLKLNMNIIFIQLAISLVYVFRAAFLIGYINKNYPELSDYKKEKPINSVVEKRKDAMIHQLSGLVVSGSQTTILTVLMGLGVASVYSVYNIVFSGLQSICSNLSTALTPFLGREYALNNREKMLKMYDFIEFAFFNIVAFIYSVTMIMIVPFVSVYTRNADINYIYPIFAVIFVYTSAFYILKIPSNALINISGHFKETRWRAILEAALTLGLSIILTKLLGINGVVLGTGIALAWRCLDTIVYSNKNILLCKNKKSLLRLIRVLVILSITAFFSLKMQINITNFFAWIKYAIITSIVIIIILIINVLMFDLQTLKNLKKVIKRKKSKDNT